MRLIAATELVFFNQGPTPIVLMLRPRSRYGQWVSAESYDTFPGVSVTEYTDIYGNLCQRVVAPAGAFRVSASATVHVANSVESAPGLRPTAIEALPDAVLHFLIPSRYCESDKLDGLAGEVASGAVAGYDQVERIRTWIHDNVRYEPGSSTSSTSAVDTAEQRQGVCRDMAHLGIALTRSLDIPARMVVGYLEGLDPMDLHAWFEAYIGDRWYTFDSHPEQTRAGSIVIAHGRDAADVALATQFGPSQLTQLTVRVERSGPEDVA